MLLPRRDFFRHAAATGSVAAAAIALAPHITVSADNDRRVKVGQIGTAHSHAAGKIAALRKLSEDFEVVGVVEPDAARRGKAQQNPAYAGLNWLVEEELLGTRGLKAVVVETSVSELAPTALRCVTAGKHVHLDKPGGDSDAQFKQLFKDADASQIHVQMGYMLRNNPGIQFLRKAVHEGWLGEIFEIHGAMGKTASNQERLTISQFSGGGMFELGGHLIDLIVAILGQPIDVTALTRRSRAPADNLADNQLAVLKYPKCAATVRIALMDVDGVKRRQFVVCGSEGTVDIRPLEPPLLQLALNSPRGEYRQGYQPVKLPPTQGRYNDQLKEFAQVICGDREPSFTASHDVAVHETLLKASDMLPIHILEDNRRDCN